MFILEGKFLYTINNQVEYFEEPCATKIAIGWQEMGHILMAVIG